MSVPRVEGGRATRRAVEPVQDPLHEAEIIPFASPETEVPERFRPREYGFEHEFTSLPLRAINMLGQVRHERNDQQTNLEKSIEEVGMRSFPEIAQFDDEHYLAYARVVHYRFQKDPKKRPSDKDLFSLVTRHTDGFIYVVVSGHSRLTGIIHNEEERSREALAEGFFTDPLDAPVKMMLRPNPTPDEMLLYQITENLHSRPPAEHIASDVLALFRYLLSTKQIKKPEDLFEHFGGKLPESTFETIMNFGKLPEDIQELAFSDSKFPFVVAARIGELAPHKRALEAFKITRGERKPNRNEVRIIERRVKGFIASEFAQMGASIHKSKNFGISLQIQRVKGIQEGLIRDLENEGVSLFGTTLEDWDMTQDQLEDADILAGRKKAKIALDALIEHPVEMIDGAVQAYSEIVQIDDNATSIRARDERMAKIIAPVLERVGMNPAPVEEEEAPLF